MSRESSRVSGRASGIDRRALRPALRQRDLASHSPGLERLEERALLSVSFVPGPYQVPAVNRLYLPPNPAHGSTPAKTPSDDREGFAADHYASSPDANNLYIAWTRFQAPSAGKGAQTSILFSRSTNQGVTWSAPITLSAASAAEGFVTDPNIT